MSAIRPLAARGSVYAVVSIAQLAVGALVTPAVTRLLEPGPFGRAVAGSVAAQLLGHLLALGLPSAIAAFHGGPEGPDAARGVARRGVGVALAIALVIAAAVGLSGVLGDASVDGAAATMAGGGIGAVMVAQAFLRSAERVRGFVVVAVTAVAGAQGGAVAGAVVAGTSGGYLVGSAVGAVAAALLAALLLVPRGLEVSVRSVPFRAAIALGGPMVAHGLAIYALAAGDRLVVGSLLGSDGAGRYQVAYLVGSLGFLAVAAVGNAWTPAVLNAGPRWAAVLASTAPIVTWTATAGAAGAALLAPYLLVVAAPAAYRTREATAIACAVAVAAPLHAVYVRGGLVLLAQRRTRVQPMITPVVALGGLVACGGLTVVAGPFGAAVATPLAYVALAVVTLRFAEGHLHALRACAPQLGLAAVAAVAGAALPGGATGAAPRLLLLGGACVIALDQVRRAARSASSPEPA